MTNITWSWQWWHHPKKKNLKDLTMQGVRWTHCWHWIKKWKGWKKNPLKRNFIHFMRTSLNGNGINPHKLKVRKDIVQEKVMEVFGKGTFWLSFQYIKCRDAKMKIWVEKIWPLCYEKMEMHYTKFIAKEFALDIDAKKLEITIY
jgi:hypothetical protein